VFDEPSKGSALPSKSSRIGMPKRCSFGRLDRYILKIAAVAAIVLLVGLTSVIWVTQALREVDLITGKGQTVLIFFTVTLLSLPALIAGIAPVALFMATLYTLNRLNSDSELIVMNAAGVAPRRLTRPFIVLTLATSLIVCWMTLSVMPAGFRAARPDHADPRRFRRQCRQGRPVRLARFRRDLPLSREIGRRAGRHLHAGPARSQPASIYIAERGRTVDVDGNSFLMLEKGTIQRESRRIRPRSSPSSATRSTCRPCRAMPRRGRRRRWRQGHLQAARTLDLGAAATRTQRGYYKLQEGRFRAELHNRLSAPLYPIAFMLIAFAAIGEARTTRQGRAVAIQAASSSSARRASALMPPGPRASARASRLRCSTSCRSRPSSSRRR
jgi:lipopolysaccharide export system permease protein